MIEQKSSTDRRQINALNTVFTSFDHGTPQLLEFVVARQYKGSIKAKQVSGSMEVGRTSSWWAGGNSPVTSKLIHAVATWVKIASLKSDPDPLLLRPVTLEQLRPLCDAGALTMAMSPLLSCSATALSQK
jgi:hypothetical protein